MASSVRLYGWVINPLLYETKPFDVLNPVERIEDDGSILTYLSIESKSDLLLDDNIHVIGTAEDFRTWHRKNGLNVPEGIISTI